MTFQVSPFQEGKRKQRTQMTRNLMMTKTKMMKMRIMKIRIVVLQVRKRRIAQKMTSRMILPLRHQAKLGKILKQQKKILLILQMKSLINLEMENVFSHSLVVMAKLVISNISSSKFEHSQFEFENIYELSKKLILIIQFQ